MISPFRDKLARLQVQELVGDAGFKIQSLWGWKRYLASVVSGALGALGLEPYNLFPLTFLSLGLLILLTDGAMKAKAPHRVAFLVGLGFGFGYFLAGMYWLAFAFLVQADQYAWMIPIAIPGFMAFLSIFVAIPVWLASFYWGEGLYRAFVLTVALSIFEFLRGHVLTGLPWNLFGQVLSANIVTAQPAAWVGPYGLTILTIFVGTMIGAVWPVQQGKQYEKMAALLALSAFMLIVVSGSLRLWLARDLEHPAITVAAMQPNVPQRDKLVRQKRDEHFRQLLEDTKAALPEDEVAYAIWPENAYPYLDEAVDASEYFASIFPERSYVVSGTIRSWEDEELTRFANSAVVFGATEQDSKPLVDTYDKHHLVPFGEYMPLGGVLRALGLSALAPVDGGFTPGSGPRIIEAGPTRFAPLICFEDVFPLALYPRGERPDWLVVVTNDAWFGDGAGPKQHLQLARLRAIESGLPIVRSANTGISALIGPKGDYIAQLPLYVRGAVVHALPAPLGITLYDRLGNALFLLILLGFAVSAYRTRLARSG